MLRTQAAWARMAATGIAAATALVLWPAAGGAGGTGIQLAQYYPYAPPPPRYYGYGGPPPCGAVNNPWGGAARGAAGGAIIGAIAGNAGRGAAIGAGVGFLGRAIRNSNARANGYCY